MESPRTLVVYYSRSGTTHDLARDLAEALSCDIERIRDRGVNRRGPIGYLRSGFQAWFRRPTSLHTMSASPADYDLVIIGTPVWNVSLSAPVRAYLTEHRSELPRVAFFCTFDRVGSDRVFHQMEDVCGKKPIATLALRSDEVKNARSLARELEVRAFVAALRRSARARSSDLSTAAPLKPAPV